jgi:hypothetical protein
VSVVDDVQEEKSDEELEHFASQTSKWNAAIDVLSIVILVVEMVAKSFEKI